MSFHIPMAQNISKQDEIGGHTRSQGPCNESKQSRASITINTLVELEQDEIIILLARIM